MSNTAIKVENLGKMYRLGEVGTGTIGHDLNRWWARMRGKEDPFAKIGETNDRTAKGNSDYVWSLKDINFEVKAGEVLGIIGRNGAGKSTLLKILSKVTAPTTGKIKVKGRIASLLEVGTGFHPELTGRENIFLNGAILGMSKNEIRSKFDAIVDFAGVERYIDTPVKRYSSGMYVRLAFAVSAFLEPDILIIDEVLAVGDAEFQKKCMGKMSDVNKEEGRTILFVSHNLNSLSQLCKTGIYLDKGRVRLKGSIDDCINLYLTKDKQLEIELVRKDELKEIFKPEITFIRIDSEKLDQQELDIFFKFKSPFLINSPSIGIVLYDATGTPVFGTNNRMHNIGFNSKKCSEGEMRVQIKDLSLIPGTYSISAFLGDSLSDYSSYPEVLTFDFQNEKIESTQIPDRRIIGSLYLTDVKWVLNANKI